MRCNVIDIIALVGLSLATCAPRAEDTVARPIPGTERLAVEQFCITVSPDEQWLTFVEWQFPAEERAKNPTLSGYATSITSINLKTATRVRHSIDSLSPEALGFSPEDRDWKSGAGLRLIKERFRPQGWIRGSYYFQRYGRGTYLALDPSQPDIKFVNAPDATGTCSDCPPMTSVDLCGKNWDLLSDDVSVVVQGGRARSIYYSASRSNRAHAIFRAVDGREDELIVERHRLQGTMVTITRVRVSPNERHLAYVVHSKKQELLSGPSDELVVRDLLTGEENRIASFGRIGNLIWSPMGERLYFAGGGLALDGNAYVVDVNAAFGK